MKKLKALLLILCVPSLAYAEGQSKLVDLLTKQDIALETSPEHLISGTHKIVLSAGPWPDEKVASFKQKYHTTPLALPLTSLAQPNDQPQGILTAKKSHIYMLYVNASDAPSKEQLTESLRALIGDDFQTQLNDSGYTLTSPYYQRMWRVQLGLEAPRFSGGSY